MSVFTNLATVPPPLAPALEQIGRNSYGGNDQSLSLYRFPGEEPLFYRSEVDEALNPDIPLTDNLALDIIQPSDGKRAVEQVRRLSYRNNDQSLFLYRFQSGGPLFYRSKLSCDVDGAPNAYNPLNDDLALDVIQSADGKRADDTPNSPITSLPSPDVVLYENGVPYLQPDGPYKGFYLSKTSLENPALPETSPIRYLDARVTQYVVLPEGMVPEATLGDLMVVFDPTTRRLAFAIFGDIGPTSESGEASLATLQRLGLAATDGKSSPGEDRNDFLFVVFPHTAHELAESDKWPYSQATIDLLGTTEFNKWGGMQAIDDAEEGIDGSLPPAPERFLDASDGSG